MIQQNSNFCGVHQTNQMDQNVYNAIDVFKQV